MCVSSDFPFSFEWTLYPRFLYIPHFHSSSSSPSSSFSSSSFFLVFFHSSFLSSSCSPLYCKLRITFSLPHCHSLVLLLFTTHYHHLFLFLSLPHTAFFFYFLSQHLPPFPSCDERLHFCFLPHRNSRCVCQCYFRSR